MLLAGSGGAAVACAFLLGLFVREDEADRLRDALAEVASHSSPEVAVLLQEAGDVAEGLLRRLPASGDAMATTARLYDRLGKTEEAVRAWQRCMALDSAFSPASHAAIASLALEKGDHETAVNHFRIAFEQDPRSSSYPVQLAEALIGQGKLREAVEILEENLAVRPRSVPTLVLLGQAYLQLGEYGKTRKRLELAVEAGPDQTNAYYGLAMACAKLGEKEESKQYLEKFKELQAKDEQRHRNSLQTADDAAEFQKVVAGVHAAAGRIYIAHGSISAGEQHLHRAMELAPGHVQARSMLARLYEIQGRADEALAALAELAEKAPDNLAAQMTVATACTRLGRLEEAETAYRRAITLTPQQAGGYVALANFYLRTGRNAPAARELALKAVQLEPTAKNYALLSMVCARSGDRPGALLAVDRAIELDPVSIEYQSLRDTIEGKK